MSNAVNGLRDIFVAAGEIDRPYTKAEILSRIFVRKGCTSYMITEQGPLFRFECLAMKCSCSSMSKMDYNSNDFAKKSFPILFKYAGDNDSVTKKLRLIETKRAGRHHLGPDQQVTHELTLPDFYRKCVSTIQENQFHFYESVTSYIAISKIKGGRNHAPDELIVVSGYSQILQGYNC